MQNFFLKTVRFYSLIIITIGALIAFIPFAFSGFNLNFVVNSLDEKLTREYNTQKTYTDEIKSISLISINTNNTNVNIMPSKSNKIKITYFENADEKYNILKTQNGISITYKNNNPPKKTLLQKIPFSNSGNPPSKYENNDLIIEIPEYYDGDINFVSKSENGNNGPLKINELKNLNHLNVDFSDLLTIENVSCRNNINIKTSRDCDLTNVSSGSSIKISTVVGEINLDNVSGKNILDVYSVDGPIKFNKIYSDRIYLDTHLTIRGTVYGEESNYIKKVWKNGEEPSNIENPENKKILIANYYSNISFST